MSDDRYERGTALVAEIYGNVGSNVLGSLRDVAPDLARYVREFAFGDIYSRPGLDLKSREIAIVASLVTLGTAKTELHAHLHGALNVGVTREELVEVIMQMTVYAGFPVAISGMRVLADVLKERGELTPADSEAK